MKRIILLSDGTGNSAANVWRTNVWRTFEAIDLSRSDQVAIYDDGVGSSSFKPWALLGGAFGYGLKRNVLNLYKFVCRNYQPGDDIFAFGFSRGSFTIRTLVGFILDRGLVQYETEDELEEEIRAAYRKYRAEHFITYIRIEVPFRWLRNLFFRSKPSKPTRRVNKIRFLGLWDTVAAYGLPVDEMTRGISRYLWPLELPGRRLDSRVKRACHALSLDDERTTFHPVLWNESTIPANKKNKRRTRDETISQVWFAGVHANVGGGYPDDSLAHVSLNWILREAKYCGLKFKNFPHTDPDSLLNLKGAQDKDGRLYDSRSGLAGYYRYGPRDVAQLCDTRKMKDLRDFVHIEDPKIHESVFARMKVGAHLYAPIGLPRNYKIVTNDGRIVSPGSTSVKSDSELANRIQVRHSVQHKKIWNAVWRRRIVYFLTLIATISLLAYPIYTKISATEEYSTQLRIVSDAIRLTSIVAPSIASRWIDTYARAPLDFLVSAGLVALLLLVGATLAAKIPYEMDLLWRYSLDKKKPNLSPLKRIISFVPADSKIIKSILYVFLTLTASYPFLKEPAQKENPPQESHFAGILEQISNLVPWIGKLFRDCIDDIEKFLVNSHWSFAADWVKSLIGALGEIFESLSSGPAPFLAFCLLFALLLPENWIYGLRSSPVYKWLLNKTKYVWAPLFFALVFGLSFLYLGLAGVNHLLFYLEDSSGLFCEGSKHRQWLECEPANIPSCIADKKNCVQTCHEKILFFKTEENCHATNIRVEKGKKYLIVVGQPSDEEFDKNDDLKAISTDKSDKKWTFFGYDSDIRGLQFHQTSWKQDLLATALWPLKRALDRPYGAVIARYGSKGSEESFLDPDLGLECQPKNDQERKEGTWLKTCRLDEILKPTKEGELFIYLNKPVSGIWGLDRVYPFFVHNFPSTFSKVNSGVAKVTVKLIP
jgi:hypothetical protein